MERFYDTASRFIFVCAVGLCGCVAPARAPLPAADADITTPRQSDIARSDNDLLRYIESVRAMPAPQLEREAAIVDRDARSHPSVANRLRLGVFLGFAPPPYRATDRAQEMLDGVWRDDNEQRDIVRLLIAVLRDRHDIEATLQDERRQRQALRSKLDQLKAIEEDIDRRMQPSTINPR